MKFFTNKKMWQKMLIILLLFIIFQFVATRPVQAVDGNVLVKPIMSLFVHLGDAVMTVVQDVLMQTNR